MASSHGIGELKQWSSYVFFKLELPGAYRASGAPHGSAPVPKSGKKVAATAALFHSLPDGNHGETYRVFHNMKSPSHPTNRVVRDADTGRFEANPYNDPELLDQLVKVVRAVKDLEPMLSASVLAFKQIGDDKSALAASITGGYLATLRDAALSSLQVDPESLKDAKKKRIEAKRLGNLPLAEQNRIRLLADDWKLQGMTPAKLLRANPQVMESLIRLASSVSGFTVGSHAKVLSIDAKSEDSK